MEDPGEMSFHAEQVHSSLAGKGLGYARKAAGLLDFFLRARVLRKRIPLIASFKLTYRCNLACAACPFHRLSGMPGSHMSRENALRCLTELENMGCRIVVFEGGEPLLWRDGIYTFRDLAREARRRFLCVGATTNGTLPLDVPTDVLWVSIDGLKETHNSLRSGSFDALMDNIRCSKHPKLFAHYTLNARNWRDFPATAEVLRSMEQVRGITVQFFYPYSQGEDDLRLSPEERADTVRLVLELKDKGYPILNSKWGLASMVHNTWRCRDWLLANVEPDAGITLGCYVRNRGTIVCRECGFTPVAEASGALDLRPGSLRSGWDIFLS
jgi:MoaA/NifB/PqqE/SkfB family radical SAM enzyme